LKEDENEVDYLKLDDLNPIEVSQHKTPGSKDTPAFPNDSSSY